MPIPGTTSVRFFPSVDVHLHPLVIQQSVPVSHTLFIFSLSPPGLQLTLALPLSNAPLLILITLCGCTAGKIDVCALGRHVAAAWPCTHTRTHAHKSNYTHPRAARLRTHTHVHAHSGAQTRSRTNMQHEVFPRMRADPRTFVVFSASPLLSPPGITR